MEKPGISINYRKYNLIMSTSLPRLFFLSSSFGSEASSGAVPLRHQRTEGPVLQHCPWLCCSSSMTPGLMFILLGGMLI